MQIDFLEEFDKSKSKTNKKVKQLWDNKEDEIWENV